MAGEEVVVGPEPGGDGFRVVERLSGTFIQMKVRTRKLEMTKAVMAFEPKTSQGQRRALPARVFV